VNWGTWRLLSRRLLREEEEDQQRGLRQQRARSSSPSLYFDALTYQVTTATILIT
jgi:hypothetical protein